MIMLTCMKDSNNQKNWVDKFLLVVAVVDGPLTQAVVDTWDPSVSPKLKRNTKAKLLLYY